MSLINNLKSKDHDFLKYFLEQFIFPKNTLVLLRLTRRGNILV